MGSVTHLRPIFKIRLIFALPVLKKYARIFYNLFQFFTVMLFFFVSNKRLLSSFIF